MPQLIFINGAPGSGKSTLARRLVDSRPLALLLDVDSLRGQLGQWRENPGSTGLTARRIALEMARTHLNVGHDVVVPQFIERPGFIEDVRAVGQDTGADFVLVALVSSPEEAASRFQERVGSTDPNHLDAVHLQSAPGARRVEDMYAGMLELLATYEDVRYVQSAPGDIDGTFEELCRRLAE
ncbi:MAG TPA: AAA family ATPase [Propionibacteriaceae bacterium]